MTYVAATRHYAHRSTASHTVTFTPCTGQVPFRLDHLHMACITAVQCNYANAYLNAKQPSIHRATLHRDPIPRISMAQWSFQVRAPTCGVDFQKDMLEIQYVSSAAAALPAVTGMLPDCSWGAGAVGSETACLDACCGSAPKPSQEQALFVLDAATVLSCPSCCLSTSGPNLLLSHRRPQRYCSDCSSQQQQQWQPSIATFRIWHGS